MREWLVGLLGSELADKALYLVVAAIVLVLLFAVIWVARKALGGSIGPRNKGRGPRLAVMDVAAIDPKRKLVLIRRDEVEHLLLVGGQNDVVVEAGILRIPAGARSSRLEPALRSEPEPDDAARQPGANAIASSVPMPATLASARPHQPAAASDRPMNAPVPVAENRGASPLRRAVPRRSPPDLDYSADPVPSVEPPRSRVVGAFDRETPSFAEEADEAEARPPEAAWPDVRAAGDRRDPAGESPAADGATLEDATRASARERPAASVPTGGGDAGPFFDVQADAGHVPETDEDGPREPDARETEPLPPAPVATPQPAPIPRRQISSAPAAIDRTPARPASPVAVPVAGLEPPRRTVPPQAGASVGSRSMATPTYPARPAPPASGNPSPDASVSPIGEADAAATAGPFLTATYTVQSSPERPSPVPDAAPPPLSSPIIAAAERQQDLVRARSIQAPPRSTLPAAGTGEGNPAPPVPKVPRENDEDASEKRPLSVRSFATVIQARKASYEPAMPAPPPVPAGQRQRDPDLVVPAAVAATVPAAIDPASASTSLEDFLSAELDSSFDDGDWLTDAGQPVPPEAETRRPEVEAAPVVTVDKADTPPRSLTLEEEMERLLGDFDFETSSQGRKI